MSAFGEAFKKARAAGKKIFTHNGKKYTTQTKDDIKKATTPVKVTAKRKPPIKKPAPKPATVGSNYKKMADKPGGVPGKAKPKPKTQPNKRTTSPKDTVVLNTPKATATVRPKRKVPAKPKPKAKPKAKPKTKKYGRQKDTVVLNTPRTRKQKKK